jgi:hypothetical protein
MHHQQQPSKSKKLQKKMLTGVKEFDQAIDIQNSMLQKK